MAHSEQLAFVELIPRYYAEILSNAVILEIGSYNVNGTVRNLFGQAKEYIGADLTPGPGVDVVKSGHELDYPDGYFTLTLSCECFEHNPYWLETFRNMIRMTRRGGIVAFTCATTGRVEHGTRRSDSSMSPGTSATGIDYYRNLIPRDFENKLRLEDYFSAWKFFVNNSSYDLYFIGIRKGGADKAYDPALLETEIERIRMLMRREFSLPRYFIYRLSYLPLNICRHLLNEKNYQTLAVPYTRFLNYACNNYKMIRQRFM